MIPSDQAVAVQIGGQYADFERAAGGARVIPGSINFPEMDKGE